MSLPAFDELNARVIATFADPAAPCTYNPVVSAPGTPPFPLLSPPLDVIRKEGEAPGNFTLRWVQKADLDAAGVIPARGDQLTVEDGVTVYNINQVQADAGGGVKLILLKAVR